MRKNAKTIEPEQNLGLQQNKTITPPVGIATKMFCNHLGKISSNLSIFLWTFAMFSFLSTFISFLIPAIYFLVLIIITFFSLGTSFLYINDFESWWHFDPTFLTNFSIGVIHAAPWLCGAATIFSAITIAMALADKHNRNWSMFTMGLVFGILSAITFAFSLAFGGVL